MKIGELAKRSTLSAHTIRYYERIGLLPYADRDASGQRDYDDTILGWIDFIGKMKSTGMPIQTMLKYASYRKSGDTDGVKRRDILMAHRTQLRERITQMQDNLLVLDHKINGYTENIKRIETNDIRPDNTCKSV